MTGTGQAGRARAEDQTVVAAWVARSRAWLEGLWRQWTAHPVRLAWTLVVTAALLSAVWPLIHDARGFWVFAVHWGLFKDRQIDYGEGPLFNQEVILYHLLFDHGNPAYRGQTIYTLGEHPPFILGNYPPVFPLVGALFMRIFGMTFTAGRMVSTLSVYGAAILVGLIVWQGTGQVLPAILGGGVLITMPLGIGTWGPFNRVDSLALFWSMLTVFLVLRYAGTRKVWWAVPVALLTVYTRQSMVDGVFAAFCYLVVRDWRRSIAVGLVTIAAGLGLFVLLQILTHGAFYLNTVVDNENAFQWSVTLQSWHQFITHEGLFIFPLAVAGAAAGFFGTGSVLWAVWLAGSVFVFATIGKTGAAANYYYTLEAASAACAAIFVGRFRTFFRRAPFPLWPLELIMPATLFLFVHGSPPRWLPARLPLAQRAMQLVGSYTVASSPTAALSTAPAPIDHQGPDTPMIDYLRTIQGHVLAIDFPHGVVPQSGHQMQWQPFEYSVAYADGTWNPAPFIAAIRDRYYAAVISRAALGGYISGPAAAEITAGIHAEYHYTTTISGYHIWLRNAPPTTAPPVVPQVVPHPLSALGHFLLLRTLGLPAAVWHALAAVRPLSTLGFTPVNIRADLNTIGVETPGVPALVPTGFDGSGNFLSTAADFPPAGGFSVRADGYTVPFDIPPSGSDIRSVWRFFTPASIPLPRARDSALWLLVTGVNLTQQSRMTLQYTSGPPSTQVVSFTDWCLAPDAAETVAFRGATRLNAQGQVEAPACGMFAVRLATDPHRVLERVLFGANPNIVLAAVTVQKAPPGS